MQGDPTPLVFWLEGLMRKPWPAFVRIISESASERWHISFRSHTLARWALFAPGGTRTASWETRGYQMEIQIDTAGDKTLNHSTDEATAHVAQGIDESQPAPAVSPKVMEIGTADESQAMSTRLAAVQPHIIRSANWFYWIAGLSLANVASGVFGGSWKFAIGLGMSEVLSGLAMGINANGGSTTSIFLLYGASLCVTAFFAACGWFARRPSVVAFVVGMTVFALDTLIFVYVQDWIGVAFHGLALFYLWRGLSITRQFKKLQK